MFMEDAQEIRRLLSDCGLSQRKAANALGVEERVMRYWCAGKYYAPPYVMMALKWFRQEQR
jgi:DNA-binding transcriptional regulator YiaG